jgi:hypothetical protein
VPRYHPLLAYPWYTAAVEGREMKEVDCMLRLEPVGTCLTALLQGWCWSLWPAQLQAMEDWQQQAAAAAEAGWEPGSVSAQESDQLGMDTPAIEGQPHLLWPLLPGAWSGLQVPFTPSDDSRCRIELGQATEPGDMQGVLFPLKPSLQQLQVALEGCVLEQQRPVSDPCPDMHGLSPGLLLLVILLSAADPPVRLAFLAGLPGEVLLMLLAAAAGEEGAAQEGGSAARGPGNSAVSEGTFHLWQSDQGGAGALGLQDRLQLAAGIWNRLGTRHTVLLVLLWCFFEVAPLQEQQEVAGQEAARSSSASSSSCSGKCSSSSGRGVNHVHQLAVAARHGTVLAAHGGEVQWQMTYSSYTSVT